jgi:futalosine hydrolase
MILLAAAVEDELRFWKRRDDVRVLITGIGPVEAAASVATELAQRPYELVVSAGIAGAFAGAARIGEGIVVAEDAMELNLESGADLVLPRGATVVSDARSDVTLVAGMRDRGFAALRGITVTHVTCSDDTARRLSERGAQAESMEGFAVLRAAQRAGVAAIELRGISNRCGKREQSGWDFDAGVAALEHVIGALFELRAGRSGSDS